VRTFCTEWALQNNAMERITIHTGAGEGCRIVFDADHLRRVLVNLLDNALRYTHNQPESIQVFTQPHSIAVWSEAQPLDQSIERHLFEPFFSSESRSSGMGLFICRELCERHHASIHYQRNIRNTRGLAVEGNEFVVSTFQHG
jgi:two-component system sensor histidine kinase PilS (NtrC family)